MTLCTCFTVLAARGLPSRPDRPLPVAPWCSSHRYRASRSSGGYFRDVLTPKRGCNVTRRVSVESGSAGLQAARSILEPGFKQIAEGVFAGCVMAASLNLGQKAREPCPSFKFACHVESASDAPGGSGGGIPARRYDNAPGISSPLEMAAAPDGVDSALQLALPRRCAVGVRMPGSRICDGVVALASSRIQGTRPRDGLAPGDHRPRSRRSQGPPSPLATPNSPVRAP